MVLRLMLCGAFRRRDKSSEFTGVLWLFPQNALAGQNFQGTVMADHYSRGSELWKAGVVRMYQILDF
jgi:hypothetical protein